MNPRSAILDTGLLVAALDRQDTHHAWAKSILLAVPAPAITCEAVITETLFLLSRISGGEQAVFGLFRKQVLRINFALDVEYATIDRLMQTYRSVPMSLADACLVRMSFLSCLSWGLLSYSMLSSTIKPKNITSSSIKPASIP
jgi:uncharacterized protein